MIESRVKAGGFKCRQPARTSEQPHPRSHALTAPRKFRRWEKTPCSNTGDGQSSSEDTHIKPCGFLRARARTVMHVGTACANLLVSKQGQRGSTCTRSRPVQLRHTLFVSKDTTQVCPSSSPHHKPKGIIPETIPLLLEEETSSHGAPRFGRAEHQCAQHTWLWHQNGCRGVNPKNSAQRAGSLSGTDKYQAKATGQQIRAGQRKRNPRSPWPSHSSP